MITVNPELCNKDGICADVCPIKIISFTDGQLPQPVPGADQMCIRCGHCVAACPTGALSHAAMAPEDCPPVRPEWQLSFEQAAHFLRSRRSIRVYRKKAVSSEDLTRLMETASYAPSGHNRQPVSWHVIYRKDELHRLTGLAADWMRDMIRKQPAMAASMHMELVVGAWDLGVDVICRNAPHLIIVHGPGADVTAQTAATIALTYLDLAAPTLDLGTCWAGFFQAAAMLWPPLQKALALPKGHVSYGAMMIGYPRHTYHRLPLRNPPAISWQKE
jgi:nitroreductase/NAD-dependent dihydropyrimidine dehydrogenase PreA subunit